MASNLRVDTILPSSGTNVANGTASGTVSLVGNSNLTTTGNLTIGGNLGIGGTLTYEDVTTIDSVGVITARSDISIADKIIHTGDTNTAIRFPAADTFTVETAGGERFRIDSSGRALIGTNTSRAVGGNTSKILEIESTDASSALSITRNSANDSPAILSFGKSRSASNGGTTVVQSGDLIGEIQFAGADGTDLVTKAATITGIVDGTPGSNDMPGRLIFSTTADGAASPTERLRIDSSGNLGISTSVIQIAYKTYNTPGYRYHSRADGFIIRHGGSGTNFTITGMNQGFASLRIGAYSEGQRINFRADIGGYNAGDAGVRLYDSNEITNQATAYGSGSCSITVTKNNASYVVNVTQTNSPGGGMAGFYHFETGGFNSVSTLTIADT